MPKWLRVFWTLKIIIEVLFRKEIRNEITDDRKKKQTSTGPAKAGPEDEN